MTVTISPKCREVIVTEASIKEIQQARNRCIAEAEQLEAEAKRKRWLATTLTASLCMIQLSIRK